MLASRECVKLQTLCSAPTCLAAELLLGPKFFGLHSDFAEIIEKAGQRTPGHDGLHFVASRHEPDRFGGSLDGLHFRMGAGPAKATRAPAVMTSALALLRKSTATGASVAPIDLDAKPAAATPEAIGGGSLRGGVAVRGLHLPEHLHRRQVRDL